MPDHTQTTDPILVVGATGKTGRRVAEGLSARGVPVRLGSRSATPSFDWEDPSTWPAALAGTSAAYVSFYPDIAVPGAPEAIAAFAERALEAGTKRIVLLSGRGEEEAQRGGGGHYGALVPTGRSCAARGSCRTSARASFATRCSPARSHYPPTGSSSRSSTSTTSPRSRSRRSPTTATWASSTSSRGRAG